MIVADPGAQSQVVSDGEVVLSKQRPVHRTGRNSYKDVSQGRVVPLVLLYVVDNLRSKRHLVLLKKVSVQIHFGVRPAAVERIRVYRTRPVRQPGRIRDGRQQRGMV